MGPPGVEDARGALCRFLEDRHVAGTGGSSPGTEYWAVCIAASGDVDPDNDCALAGETIVIRDPDAVDGGELVADSSGELAVGATAETEFTVNDVTGEEFQMQPHWFLLG